MSLKYRTIKLDEQTLDEIIKLKDELKCSYSEIVRLGITIASESDYFKDNESDDDLSRMIKEIAISNSKEYLESDDNGFITISIKKSTYNNLKALNDSIGIKSMAKCVDVLHRIAIENHKK